jgi:hypothetical protein
MATGHKVTSVFTGTLDADKARRGRSTTCSSCRAARSTGTSRTQGRSRQPRRSRQIRRRRGCEEGAEAHISSVEALKKTILSAKSSVIPPVKRRLYRLAVRKTRRSRAVKPKAQADPDQRVRRQHRSSSEVEIGFQQVSELSHLPRRRLRRRCRGSTAHTVFSGGVIAGAKEADAAKALVKFLTAPAAAQAFKKQGMEPG